MQYRPLGKTGLSVSVLSQGGAAIGQQYGPVSLAETVGTLQRLKKEGKARFIGVSCYPLGLLRRAIERCELDVVISYCHYTLQNTRLVTELLPVAEVRGVGVLNASPLSMGLLTNQG